MKTLLKIALVFIIALTALTPAQAQTKKQLRDAKQSAEIKDLVNSRKFTFNARYVYPLGGGQRYLTSDYDVRVTPDTIVAFLPYFGVAYSGSGYNSNEDSGIKFTSAKFEYKTEVKKDGAWYIVVNVNDSKTTRRLAFNVSSNGNADLVVTSNNRQQIRFSGLIAATPKTKK